MGSSATASLRLLFILDTYAPHIGGVETMFARICAEMVERGHAVRVLTRGVAGAPARESIDGVDVIRVPAASRFVFAVLALPWAVWLSRRADVVHATTFASSVPAALAAAATGRPSLLTILEVWTGKWRERTTFGPFAAMLHDVLERAALCMPFERVVAISHATGRDFVAAFPRKAARLRVVRNGFDMHAAMCSADAASARRSRGIVSEEFLVCGFGRPGRSKGFIYLAKAFHEVRARLPRARLVLVLDDAAEYRKLRDEIVAAAPQGSLVEPALSRAALGALLRGADCIAVPSLCEGFGYAALEASASGAVVVASDAGSLPEVLGGKRILVPPADTHELAAGIVAAAEGRFETLPLRSFPWGETIDGYEACYRELLERRTGRSS